MKQETVRRLVSLMKTKTQLERFNYEEVKHRNQAALQNADALRKEAMATHQIQPSESGAMLYQQHEKHVTRLFANAKSEKQYADSLIDLMGERRVKVKAALQREIALEEVKKRLDNEYRQSRNKREETQHELVRSMKTIRREA